MAVELFNNGKHIVHAFYDLVDEKTTGAVQCNQFLITEPQKNCQREKGCHQQHEFDDTGSKCRRNFRLCFCQIKGRAHCHQAEWCCQNRNIFYRGSEDLRLRDAQNRP